MGESQVREKACDCHDGDRLHKHLLHPAGLGRPVAAGQLVDPDDRQHHEALHAGPVPNPLKLLHHSCEKGRVAPTMAIFMGKPSHEGLTIIGWERVPASRGCGR